jgi:hypothetical protein
MSCNSFDSRNGGRGKAFSDSREGGPLDGAILKLLQAIYQPPQAPFRAVAALNGLQNGTVALHYDWAYRVACAAHPNHYGHRYYRAGGDPNPHR